MTLKDNFLQKIEQCHDDFIEMISGMDTQEIIDDAQYIASYESIYKFLYNDAPLTDSQMQHLMKVLNPIQLIANKYSISEREMHEKVITVCDEITENKLYVHDCSKKANELLDKMSVILSESECDELHDKSNKSIFEHIINVSHGIYDYFADSLMQFKNPIEVIRVATSESVSLTNAISDTINYIENNDIFLLPHKLEHERILDETRWRHEAINEITDIVPEPDFDITMKWIDFFRTVEMNTRDGEPNNPYADFIATLKIISEEFGNNILQQLYETSNGTMMLEEPLIEAAKYLADGGDVRQIREMANQDMFLKPYEELKEELEMEAEQGQGGIDIC